MRHIGCGIEGVGNADACTNCGGEFTRRFMSDHLATHVAIPN